MHLNTKYSVSKRFLSISFIMLTIICATVNAFAGDDIAYKFDGNVQKEARPSQAAATTCSLKPVYRFYNSGTNGHFFTISEGEKSAVIANYPQFTYEGVGFAAYDANCVDPCVLNPASCAPVDPCVSNPALCQFSPQPGTWNGSRVSFNVSSDSTSLTSTNSSLYLASAGYLSLKLVLSGSSCSTVIISYTTSIPITNYSFSRSAIFSDATNFSLSGLFSNATSASGTYVYNGIGSECDGSGSWTTTR